MKSGGTQRLDPDALVEWRDHGTLRSGESSIEVGVRPVLVGRAEGCELQLDDARVSAAHLELRSTRHGVVARDLDTTNGSYVGPLRVHEVTLADGTEIRLGGLDGPRVVFRYADVPERVPAPKSRTRFERLVGSSATMQRLYDDLTQLAPTEINLLVEGETGTGKEEVARSIHAASTRSKGPFVVVDCGALAPSILESLLFGHERGAFSGASERKIGLAEAADGGTLFLDELGELPAEAQTRLLRMLEARTIRRLGSTKETKIDVRVVSATHRDVPAMIAAGEFRADLFFRLASARVHVPPLRERRGDIVELASTLLERLGFEPKPEITPDAMRALEGREFPGNVRELRNVLEVAVALGRGTIDLASVQRRSAYDEVPAVRTATSPKRPAPTAMTPDWNGELGLFREEKQAVIDKFEEAYLRALHEAHEGNLTHASAHAGIERHHLRKLLRKYGLIAPAKTRARKKS